MGFKLMQNNGQDFPVLTCDVCSGRMVDSFGDLVSASRVDSGMGNIVFHHKACAVAEPFSMSVREFFSFVVISNGFGDLASDGRTTKTTLEFPVDGRFNEHDSN